jgi:hypothetical protein
VGQTGRRSKPSPRSFSARSYETFCGGCETWFTFELGSLLDRGIDPADLLKITEKCSYCGAHCTVGPGDVLELT